jgi:histidinol-phosphate phosphatase family protein
VNSARGLILLDRDGVLNCVCVDPEHGTIDSPLHPDQVRLLPGVADALALLCQSGFHLAIVTNQPASAKGKTTQKNLLDAHEKVLSLAQAQGAIIRDSFICFHRAEDNCSCRKPKTGLLEQALTAHPGFDKGSVWMVGDGVTDVEAASRFGVRSAFLGPKKCDACGIFTSRSLSPDYWGDTLPSFVRFLIGPPS